MASTLEYMQFATGVYAASKYNTLNPTTATGWSFDQALWQPDMASGFSAGYYFNSQTNEVVISYTGTNDAVDPLFGWSAGAGIPAPQIFDAVAYYFTVKAAHPDANISFTGHSLGAGLASLMAVFFDKSSTVFDEAPFGLAAISPVVLPYVAEQMLAYGYQDAAFSDYILSAGFLAIPRASNVTQFYVSGEVLQLARIPLANLSGFDYSISLDNSTAGPIERHSMALMTALQLSDSFHQVAQKIPDLVSMILDSNLFASSPLAAKPDLLRTFLRHQLGVADVVQPDNMLNRFSTEMNRLVQAGVNQTYRDLGHALIAFAMEKYYSEPSGDVAQQAALFTAITGGMKFDTTRINADITSAKGYTQYFTNYLNTDVLFTAEERSLITQNIAGLKDWSVAVGTAGMSASDSANNGAFMLGGDGRDILTGGTGNDLLVGGRGNDILTGGSGSDTLIGGEGDDKLYGGAGNDVLVGGKGNDLLIGGDGNDTYVFNTSDGQDTIVSSSGLGKILLGATALAGAGGTQATNSGNSLTWSNGSTSYKFTPDILCSANGIGKMVITSGSDTITIDNFDLAQAQTATGYLGIQLQGYLAMAAGAASVNTASFNPAVNVQSGICTQVVTIYGEPGQVQLSGSGGNVCTGANTYSFANGPVTLTIPDGQNSVTVTVIDTNNVNSADTLNLSATMTDALGTISSNSLAITYADPNPNAGSTPSPANTINGDLNPLADAAGGYSNDANGNLVTDGTASTNFNDTLFGSAGSDVINGGGGNNVLFGLGGNDTISGGTGNDVILTGDLSSVGHKPVNYNPNVAPPDSSKIFFKNYDNTAVGASGFTVINGGGGQDIILAGNGNNLIYADTQVDFATAINQRNGAAGTGQKGDLIAVGDGNNTIVGSNGNDVVFTGTGNNTLILGAGQTTVIGGMEINAASLSWSEANNLFSPIGGQNAAYAAPASYNGSIFDNIPVGMGNDTIFGGTGNSHYWLSNGNNWLDAGGGNDYIVAGTGSSTIYGGRGNDSIWGGGGSNYINLESGNDVVVLFGGNNTVKGGTGNDLIFSGDAGSSTTTVSSETNSHNYIDTGSGKTIVWGSGGNDTIISGSLSGTGKSSTIYAGNGNAYIVGGKGNDSISGGTGNDTIYAGAGNTSITLSSAASEISHVYGGNGVDNIHGGGGTDFIFAGDGSATLQGGSGTEVMYSGAGNDVLIAGAGSDTLYGGSGTDLLQGGSGNTVFVAGSGNETIRGGSGSNTYKFDAGFGNVELQNTQASDTFVFGAGTSVTDLTVTATMGSTGNLALQIQSASGGQLVVDNGLSGAISNFKFAGSGSTLNLNDLMAQASSVSTTLTSTNGNVIFSAAGNDTLTGGAGNDTIYAWNGGNKLQAGSGNQVFFSETGFNQLTGGTGNDTLISVAGNDTITSGTGNDSIVGGAAPNTYLLNLGSGHDTISGTTYRDNITFGANITQADLIATRTADGVLLTYGSGGDSVLITGYYSLPELHFADQTVVAAGALLSVPNYAAGPAIIDTAMNDTKVNLAASSFTGSAGNHVFMGGAGDTLYNFNRGDGKDSVVDLGGQNTFAFGMGINVTDIRFSIENWGDASPQFKIYYNSNPNDVVSVLNGEKGVIDRFTFADGSSYTFAQLAELQGFTPPTSLIAQSGVLIDTTGRNFSSNNQLVVCTDNSTIYGNNDSSNVYVAGKNDTINISDNDGGKVNTILFNMGDGRNTVGVVTNNGLSLNTMLEFGAGIDPSSLTFTHSTSTQYGGPFLGYVTSNDLTIHYGTQGDSIFFLGGLDNSVSYGFANGTQLNNSQLAAVIAGSQLVKGGGIGGGPTYQYNLGSGSQLIYTEAYSNVSFGAGITSSMITLDRGNPSNNFSLGVGPLTLHIGNNGDVLQITDLGNTSNYQFMSFSFADGTSISYDQLLLRGFDIYGTTGNETLSGTNLNNRIYAGTGNDTLIGTGTNDTLVAGASADTLIGGSGNETFVINNVADVITASANAASNSIFSSVSYVMPANVQNLTLTGSDNLTATGNTISNVITGNAGFDNLIAGSGDATLIAGSGVATLTGGTGNNTFVINNVADVIVADATALSNSVISSVDYVMQNGVQSLTLTGNGNLTATGNSLNDVITGNAGNDTLIAGSGNDTLIAGSGGGTMIGGSGSDTFVFNPGSGQQTITDTLKAVGDVIQFGSGISAGNTQFVLNGADLLITFGTQGDSLLVQGFASAGATGPYSIGQFQFADRSTGVYTNDGLGNASLKAYDIIGRILGDYWQAADGTHGNDTFNLNGSSSGSIYQTTGDYSTYVSKGAGNYSLVNYAASGVKISDSWNLSDGSYGSDTYNADGSSSGASYNPDGSYSSYTKDSLGNIKTTNYDINGVVYRDIWRNIDGSFGNDYFNANGSSNSTTYFADNSTSTYTNNGAGNVTTQHFDASGNLLDYNVLVSDGLGNSTTTYYDASGIRVRDSWIKASGSYGNDYFNANGSSYGTAYFADNSTSTYTNNGVGNVTTKNFDASGNLLNYNVLISDGKGNGTTTYFDVSGNALSSVVTTNDGLGNTTSTHFDASGIKVSDIWIKADGTYGSDIFSADGSSIGSVYNADGSFSTYTNNGLGNTTSTSFDASGIKLSDTWTKADGTYGNDLFNANGSSSGTAYNADGSFSSYTNDGIGDVTTQYYDASGVLLSDAYTYSNGDAGTDTYFSNGTLQSDVYHNSDGSYGSDTYNLDGSGLGSWYNADGSYATYTQGAGGNNCVVLNYAANSSLTGSNTYNFDSLGNNITVNYDANGIKVSDSWRHADGSFGSDTYNADGSYNSVSNDGLGDVTTNYFDATGVKTSDAWSLATGSSGTDNFNPDGTLFGSSLLNADGTQSVTAGGNNLLIGSATNNIVAATSGNDILIGAAGSSTITTGTGSNIIAFDAGNGQEVVNDALGQNNTLSLGGHFAFNDLALQKSGSDLILDIGASDSITLKNWYAGNQNIVNLQVIESAMTDFASGSADTLRNSNVENFDFQQLVAAFDQAQAANPTLNLWSVTNSLLTVHLASSNSAALGGDLAYVYGTNGNLTGFGTTVAENQLSSSQFGTAPQTLNPWSTLNTGTAKLA
jgi:Ca2+-binding RTX toxin-like protein